MQKPKRTTETHRHGGFLVFINPISVPPCLRGALLLLAAVSTACVTTAQEGEEMRKDIASLRTDLKKEVDTATLERQKELDKAEHPTDRTGIYTLARQKLEAGQTGRARELLQDFLSRFPKDELAPNAQYWLGETWYAEKKWNDAIVEFQKVLKEYKGSDKVPDALLKIGMSFQAQGDCENAKLFYEEVIQAHGKSPLAKTAREK